VIRRLALMLSFVWVVIMGALWIRTGNYMWGPALIVFAPVMVWVVLVYGARFVINGNTRPVGRRRYS
jgi:hypothetical protein